MTERGRGFKLDGCKRFASYYIKEKLKKIKVAKWDRPKKLKKQTLRDQFSWTFANIIHLKSKVVSQIVGYY
jgi:hypothetical protein